MVTSRSLCLFILGLFLTLATQAKLFTSQYCEFQLPPGWECALEGTEWVCQSTNKNRKKEAIIILAAKIRGSQDSLAQYKAYLTKPKPFRLPGGKTQVSEAKYTKKNRINNHNWIDSLHLASEVPGFYTRYMATVKEDLGIAVTFSVAKDHYDAYQDVFEKIIQTLKVFRQAKVKASDYKLAGGDGTSLYNQSLLPTGDDGINMNIDQKEGRNSKDDPTTDYIIYGGIILAAAIALSKMRKKKPVKKKKKKKTNSK